MTKNNVLQAVLFITAFLSSANALAFRAGGPVQDYCREPKFKSFSLPEYNVPGKIEVPPESEFSFTLPPWTDPERIKITIKDQILPLEVQDKKSFLLVKGKIPAEYTGKFVRLNGFAYALLGCKTTDGWLVKVANAPAVEAVEENAIPAPATSEAAAE